MINLILFAILFCSSVVVAQSADYGGSSNATQIQGRVINPIAPTANQVLLWNATTAVWEPGAATAGTGTVTDVGSGTGLLGGPITTSGTLSVDVGTAANKIVQLTSTDQYPAVDGFLITNLNSVKYIGTGTGLTGGPITSTGTLAVDVGTTANKIVQLTPTGQLPIVDGFLLSNVNAVKLQGFNVNTSTPTSNQVLTWNSTVSNWQALPASSGSVTSVGLVAPSWLTITNSPITSAGSLTITATSEAQSSFLAAPSGSSGAMAPRLIVAGDIPTLNQNTTGTAGNGYTTPTAGSNFLGTTASVSLTNINVTATGVNAGPADTTGANNTFMGFNAGLSITTGSSNTIIGAQPAGASAIITTGTRNTIIGANIIPAGLGATDQVLIGASTGAAASSSNGDTVIGSLAQGNNSNQTGNTTLASVSVGFSTNGNASYAAADSVTVGAFSSAGGADDIILGTGVQSNSADTFVAGRGGNTVSTNYVTTSGANQITFGTSTKALKDLFLGNGAVGIAAPSNVSVQPTPVASGTSNTAGANLTLLGGNSTGTGSGGSIIFQTAPAGSSGTSVNTLGTVMTILGSGNIGIGTTTPRAILEVTGTGTLQSAMILPRDSTTNRPSTPVAGMLRYNTTGPNVEAYVGTAWVNLAGAYVAPTVQILTATGSTTGYWFTISSGSATVGATYTNNSNTYTVLTTVASGTMIFMSGASAPLASGTLTKSGGTGNSTLTFSANVALGTYTTPVGAILLKVTTIGGGGGGGGMATNTASGGGGGGGGGGGTAVTWISSPAATYYYSVGAGGGGGSSGANDGSAGVLSSFNSGTTWGGGGNGGRGGTASASFTIYGEYSGQGKGGTTLGPGLTIQGGSGGFGFGGTAAAGFGGSTTMGGGALPTQAAGAGNGGTVYGSGGAGGLVVSASASTGGGNGADGLVLVEEYYQ